LQNPPQLDIYSKTGKEYSMKAINKLIGKRVIIRCAHAGVFFGTLNEFDVQENVSLAELIDVRRLWFWAGATTLSQMARDGVKCPDECKFSIFEHSIIVSEITEIHACTEECIKSLEGVAIWQS